jgi:hypothetical protein
MIAEAGKQVSTLLFIFMLGMVVSYLFYQWYIQKYGYMQFLEFAKHWLRATFIFMVALVVIRIVFSLVGR